MKKLILSLAFVSLGTFAMAQQTQQMPSKWGEGHKEMMEQRKAKHMAEMQKDLNLSQTQVNQIQAIHDRFQTQRQLQRKARVESFKKDKQQMDDEMRKILTPEQYTKWQAKKAENLQKKQDRMQGKMWKVKGNGQGLHKKAQPVR